MHIIITQKNMLKIIEFLLIVLSLILVMLIIQFFSYKKVNAVITAITVNSHDSISAESNTTKNYSIKYMYNVNGVTYEVICTTFRQPRKQVGECTNIRYNPANPQNIFFGEKIVVIAIGFFFMILLIFVMRKGYTNEK